MEEFSGADGAGEVKRGRARESEVVRGRGKERKTNVDGQRKSTLMGCVTKPSAFFLHFWNR
jgi:hypothetical protein